MKIGVLTNGMEALRDSPLWPWVRPYDPVIAWHVFNKLDIDRNASDREVFTFASVERF